MSEIDELKQRVDLLERVIRRFVEHPFIWAAPSFRPLLTELGYTVEKDAERGAFLVPPHGDSNVRPLAGPEKVE